MFRERLIGLIGESVKMTIHNITREFRIIQVHDDWIELELDRGKYAEVPLSQIVAIYKDEDLESWR